MRRILLGNMAAGFPADETFVRTVDEYRECLRLLCRGLFGDRTVILSGVEREVKDGVAILTEGYVWFGDDLMYIERTKFEYLAPAEHIWLGRRSQILTGVYYNGEEKACYDYDSCYAVAIDNPGMAAAILRNYNELKRVKPLELLQ